MEAFGQGGSAGRPLRVAQDTPERSVGFEGTGRSAATTADVFEQRNPADYEFVGSYPLE
jgi:hypothetical protein